MGTVEGRRARKRRVVVVDLVFYRLNSVLGLSGAPPMSIIVPMLVSLIVATLLPLVAPLQCRIGYGQRGKMYEEGIEWSRLCPETKYCYEVISEDITVFQKLFDYPFDSYYNEFYARGCGGEWGTPVAFHPYRNNPAIYRTQVGFVKLNITTPTLITGQGGTEELVVKYICRRNLCFENAASRISAVNLGGLSALVGALVLYLSW